MKEVGAAAEKRRGPREGKGEEALSRGETRALR